MEDACLVPFLRIVAVCDTKDKAEQLLSGLTIWWAVNLYNINVRLNARSNWRKSTKRYPTFPDLPAGPPLDPGFEMGEWGVDTPCYKILQVPLNPLQS